MSEDELHNIIRECMNGNRKCQKFIFDHYSMKMMTVCLRYTRHRSDAEDVLQDGFVKVFTKMNQFKFNGSFEGWIRRIMVNSALRFLEKKKQFLPLEEGRIAGTVDIEKSFEDRDDSSEKKILALIQGLPEGYRKVLNMYIFEGYDHNEIGSILGVTASTSRSQLTKARKLLKIEMEKQKLK